MALAGLLAALWLWPLAGTVPVAPDDSIEELSQVDVLSELAAGEM